MAEDENAVLLTGYNEEEVCHLGINAGNCAVLVSACIVLVKRKTFFLLLREKGKFAISLEKTEQLEISQRNFTESLPEFKLTCTWMLIHYSWTVIQCVITICPAVQKIQNFAYIVYIQLFKSAILHFQKQSGLRFHVNLLSQERFT